MQEQIAGGIVEKVTESGKCEETQNSEKINECIYFYWQLSQKKCLIQSIMKIKALNSQVILT